MAFIRKLSTASGVRYEVRWRPAPGQAERSQRFESFDQAKAFKAQTEAAQSRGIAYDPARGRVRFQTYAEQWLEGRPLASTTRDNYAETLKRHVYPTFGTTPIGRLSPDEIRRWFRPLRDRIPSTASRAYRIIHAILATAVEDDLIPRNPCRIMGAGSDPHTERPFVPAEVVLALADIAHARIRPMILVAGFAGLRYGELRALRVRSYDRLHGTLTIRESIDKRSRRKTTKTDSSQRTVTLPRFVLDAIDAHLATFVGGDPDGPLFPGEAGGIISDGWFQREWRAARAQLGITEVHFHDLRHAAGTIATQQGATMREVMSRLGHSTTSAAIRYQKAAADRDRALAERLDDLVDRLRTPTSESESDPEPAQHPAGAAGFSRGAHLTRQRQPTCENAESPATAGDSREYPQRDSNPCRHLERDSRRGRSERQRTERVRFRGSPDVTDVSESCDSGRPRDFRGIDVGDTSVVGSSHCHAVSRCLATENLPKRRRRVEIPTRNSSALSGDRSAFGAELDLHRHAVALALEHTGAERGLVTIAKHEPVTWNRGEVRVVCTRAVADPALDHHVSADRVWVEPQVVELGSHAVHATGGGLPIQAGFSIGPSKWLRTPENTSAVGAASVTVQWGASSVASSGNPDATRSAP